MSTLPASQGQPLVDFAVLHEFERQVDDRAVTLQFVHTFVDLWESRYGRLAGALEPFDRDVVLDALLSIKASSAMCGAMRLSQSAEEMERAVVGGDSAPTEMLAVVKICGDQTMGELRGYYIDSAETR